LRQRAGWWGLLALTGRGEAHLGRIGLDERDGEWQRIVMRRCTGFHLAVKPKASVRVSLESASKPARRSTKTRPTEARAPSEPAMVAEIPANSIFYSLADIMDACETAWNRFAADHALIRSLCAIGWAPASSAP
jgi:hypothetical protein